MKCKDCIFRKVDWMSSYDGRGMIEFSFCASNIASGKLIDPDVERECADGVKKTEASEVENAT